MVLDLTNWEPGWLKPMTKNCERDWRDLRLEKNYGELGTQPRPGEKLLKNDCLGSLPG